MTTAKQTKWSPRVLPSLKAPIPSAKSFFFFFFNLKSTVKAFQSNMLDSTLKQGKGQGNREASSHTLTELYNSSNNMELQELGYQHLKHQQLAPAKNSCHCQGIHLTAISG